MCCRCEQRVLVWCKLELLLRRCRRRNLPHELVHEHTDLGAERIGPIGGVQLGSRGYVVDNVQRPDEHVDNGTIVVLGLDLEHGLARRLAQPVVARRARALGHGRPRADPLGRHGNGLQQRLDGLPVLAQLGRNHARIVQGKVLEPRQRGQHGRAGGAGRDGAHGLLRVAHLRCGAEVDQQPPRLAQQGRSVLVLEGAAVQRQRSTVPPVQLAHRAQQALVVGPGIPPVGTLVGRAKTQHSRRRHAFADRKSKVGALV